MSESDNVKVNQPDFLVKVGNMLDMVGIPAVIMILWDKQLKMRLFFSVLYVDSISARIETSSRDKLGTNVYTCTSFN